MSKLSDAEVVREITARIDATLHANRQHERVIIAALLVLFTVGLALIIWGAVAGKWELLVPGGILQMTVAFPVTRLIKLREDNVRLQILPQLMRMADTQQAKLLAAKLAERLIEQV